MNSASAMPPPPAVLADALVRRAYGHGWHTSEDWPRIAPWHEVAAEAIIPAAQRVARNALKCDDIVTDSLGVPIKDDEGSELGRLWSCRGGNKWMSAFCSSSRNPKEALNEWMAWAHRGRTPPPLKLSLVDVRVPMITASMFGTRAEKRQEPDTFDSLHAAAHHAAVISLVETCVLQRRNPVSFLTDLLAKELV